MTDAVVEPLAQPELFDSEPVTFHEARLQHCGPELIYFARWKALNRRSPGVNSGFTYLEHILTPPGRYPGPVSARDAAVAASVIQWLGTNCGMAFLRDAERAILEHDKWTTRPQIFPLRYHRATPKTRLYADAE